MNKHNSVRFSGRVFASLLGFISIPTFFSCASRGYNTDDEQNQDSTPQMLGGSAPSGGPERWSTVGLYDGARVCSGVIVDNRHVLTSAHCFNKTGAPTIAIFKNNILSYHDSDTCKIQSFIRHPSYNASGRNDTNVPFDLAIANLDCDASSKASYRSANIATLPAKPTGSIVTLAGFGRTSPTGSSGVLYALSAKISSVDTSSRSFGVTTASNQGTCVGDSGGPAFLNGTVVGILSAGTNTCSADGAYAAPGEATTLKWISDHTK